MSSIIKCYGLLWRADWVSWNATPRSSNLLLGRNVRSKSQVVDMKDQTGIYVLYQGDNMVYVGQSGARQQKLYQRLKAHKSDHLSGRWDTFSWFGLRKVINNGAALAAPTKKAAHLTIAQALNEIEAVLIAAAEPRLNKNSGNVKKHTTQYVQIRDDERLGPTEPEMLRRILEQLDSK